MQVNTRQDIDITQSKRIYCREWRIQHRSIRATVSLPRLQLVKPGQRPIFECPVCYSCNDKVPVCFWCKSTSVESEAAFWSSMPKQRTISAPVKLVSIPCEQPRATAQITATAMVTATVTGSNTAPLLDVSVLGRDEKPYQKSSVPPPPLNPSTDGAVSARSVRKRRTSYNSASSSTTTTTTTICTTTSSTSSDTTTTQETTLDSFSFPPLLRRHHHNRHRRLELDDIGRVTIVNNTILLQEREREQDAHAHSRYHSLPLRRKGHFARTTAGMIVKKTRLSALFRKDAVPVLDHPPLEPLLPVPNTNVRPRREKLKIRTQQEEFHHHHIPMPSSKRSHFKAMPTIPDTHASPSSARVNRPVPVPVPLSYAQSSGTYTTAITNTTTSNDTSYYTMPTPPSFLSPFWYHADQYGNLPSSPTSTSSPVTVASNSPRPSHSYSRSEPFPIFPTQHQHQHQHQYQHQQPRQQEQQGSSRKWKSRMGGFFRTSINVVYGRHSR